MTTTTQSHGVYSQPTKTSEAQTRQHCKVYQFEDYGLAPEKAPSGYARLSDFLADLPQEFVQEGRRWLARELSQKEHSLRALRLERGLSQAQLADLMGTSQPHIARIENGTAQIMFDTAAKLASALGVSLDELSELLRPPRQNREG